MRPQDSATIHHEDKVGSVILKLPKDYTGKVWMKYRSFKNSGEAIFPNLKIAKEAAELAVIGQYGGYQEAILTPGDDRQVTHSTPLDWLHS